MNNGASLGTSVTGLAVAVAAAAISLQAAAEGFIDIGANSTHVEADIATLPETVESDSSGWHVAGGFRRELERGSIGVRLEADDIDGELLLAIRAFDYRRHLTERIALTAFAGAARLDLDLPAHGYYLGGGVQIKDLLPKWSLSVDLRIGDTLARDNLLPTDPQGERPDNFYDLTGFAIYLSRGF